jgi:hypothetical protein
MRIWKLTPVDPSDPVWKGYDINRPMFIRAESANRAQDLATYATLQFCTPLLHPEKAEYNPWVGYKTRVEDVTDTSDYSVDGPAEVLNKA